MSTLQQPTCQHSWIVLGVHFEESLIFKVLCQEIEFTPSSLKIPVPHMPARQKQTTGPGRVEPGQGI